MIAERHRLSRFSQRPANVTNIEENNALMVGTTLHPWSVNQDLQREGLQAAADAKTKLSTTAGEKARAMAWAKLKPKLM